MAQTDHAEGARDRRSSLHAARQAVRLEDDDSEEESGKSDLDGDPKDLQQMSEVERLEAMNQFAARRKAGSTNVEEDSVAKAAAEAFAKGGTQVMLPAKEVSELPERSGWVKRMGENLAFLSSWQWRWLVLKDCRVAWFDGPDKKRLHGVIDFELVDVELERLWDDPSTSESSRSQAVRRGKDRGCRGVCISGLFGSDEAYFRLLAAGSNRAFEFGVATQKEAGYWMDEILNHLEEADRRCAGRPRLSADRLNDFQRSRIKNAWWKVSRISPETFKHVAETGDVLLFKSEGTFPRLIRAASAGGRFDHVGLILRMEGDTIGILEATGNEGVGLCTWRTFLANGWQNLYPEMALRRVRCTRNQEALFALQEWVGKVIGKPYNLSVSKLRHRGSTGGGQQDFFCSQLVAEALKVLGVIPRGQKDSAEFWPSSFSAKSAPITCSPGCSMDPEDLTIDFSLTNEMAARSSSSAKRDATVSLW
ncbi:unnamed protein product [Symbiodinium pilosum]|uniref:PH domain-containing protein n=1 Tax=Symbiodinium pilosum TaxID=2952 RepID=A0A812S4F5_SYMPI|nr:unnamed protein product [Symbiodinium pilosum]